MSSKVIIDEVPRVGDGNLYISFLPMGQGDCTLITCPNGKTVMIDCGIARANITLPEVMDMVNANTFLHNYPVLDALIVTHADRDHYSWLQNVLSPFLGKAVTIKKLYYNPISTLEEYAVGGVGNWLKTTANIKAQNMNRVTLNVASDSKAPIPVLDGKKGNGPKCDISILASGVVHLPNYYDGDNPDNTGSIVTLITFDNLKILICGDATNSTLQFLVDNQSAYIKNLHLIQIPHHGSLTSDLAAFINLVKPQIAVVSVARRSGCKLSLPRKEVLDLYLNSSRIRNTNSHEIVYYEDVERKVSTNKDESKKVLATVRVYDRSDVTEYLKMTGTAYINTATDDDDPIPDDDKDEGNCYNDAKGKQTTSRWGALDFTFSP